jgi:hypothetical protein
MIAIAGPPKRHPTKKGFRLGGNGCEGKGGRKKSDRMSYRMSRDLILKFELSPPYILIFHKRENHPMEMFFFLFKDCLVNNRKVGHSKTSERETGLIELKIGSGSSQPDPPPLFTPFMLIDNLHMKHLRVEQPPFELPVLLCSEAERNILACFQLTGL